jgi:hypothetical protein
VARLQDRESAAILLRLLEEENPVWIKRWGDAFRPLAKELITQIREGLSVRQGKEPSLNSVNLLILYAAEDVLLLAVFATPGQGPPRLKHWSKRRP